MTERKTVDPLTDNLEDFGALFRGDADPATSTQDAEDPVEDVEDADTEDETLDEETSELEAEADEESEPAPKKKKKSIQERFNDLAADKHEAINRAAQLEEKLNAVLAKLDKTNEPKETPAVAEEAGEEPSPYDLNDDGTDKYPLGEYDPAFRRDHTDFLFAEKMKEFEEQTKAKETKTQQEQAAQALTASWNANVEAKAAELPDFRTKTQGLADVMADVPEEFGEYLASTIMSLDKGPEILYYLAEHKDEARAIVSKGVVGATIALGAIEARLTGSTPKPRKVTEAPEPIPERTRGASGKFEIADDTDDLTAFRNKWNSIR